MKQTIQGFILAGTLVLGGTALAQQAGKENKKGTAELRGFVVPTDEKALLERLHYTNQMEIKLGQLDKDARASGRWDLIVVDTPSYWSGFGEAVILGLIQVGGFPRRHKGCLTLA